MLLSDVVAVSGQVAATRSRLEKIDLLAGLLKRVGPDEASIALSYLSGRPTQTRLGAGYATVYAVEVEAVPTPRLTLGEVDASLEELSTTTGSGSKARREQILGDLFGRATVEEQEFLRGMMLRNLRQGALEGVMAEAVAAAVDVPADRVRRAAMLEGDLVAVSVRALSEGPQALGGATLALFTPLQPMLARTAGSAAEAVSLLGEAVVEHKLDGLRLQVHRQGERVAIYTRNLRDITAEMPGVVDAVRDIDATSFILDGEGLLVAPDGRPLSFQESMSHPGSEGSWPIEAFFFDVLAADGVDLIDEPLHVRRQRLQEFVPDGARVGSLMTSDPAEAERFFDEAVSSGFEGVVVKDPGQPYEAGRRGSGWLKVKPVHTLDLVVLAAEWGSGRREGWLSNLHLGASDGAGGFVMLGKTFKGLTDEMLTWQTETFLAIEDHRSGHVVFIEPKIVYEVAFDGVQRSSRYPGGVALRFARVKGYRSDKGPGDIDTIETVRSFIR